MAGTCRCRPCRGRCLPSAAEELVQCRYGDVIVTITFDDGPDADGTRAVLDALKAAHVKATFFVVAEQIERPEGPELLRAIVDDGHVIQAHCGTHSSHHGQSREQLETDARRILDVLAQNGVPAPLLWRPPYGQLSKGFSCSAAAAVGLQLVLWTHDTADWTGRSAEEMLRAAKESPFYKDSVILMHDSRRYADNKDTSQTVALIEPLVEWIRAGGFDIGPLTTRLPARPRRAGVVLVPCAGPVVQMVRRFQRAKSALGSLVRTSPSSRRTP